MSWLSELDALRNDAREALQNWETALAGTNIRRGFTAAQHLSDVLHDFLRFTDQIAGGQPRQQTCEMDGYSDWGRGPEQCWHCEKPAIYRAMESGLDLCEEHAQGIAAVVLP